MNSRVEYLFHHLFLPPKLPGGDDTSTSNTVFLTEFVLNSLRRFTDELVEENAGNIRPAIPMLQGMQSATESQGLLAQVGVERVLEQISLKSMYSHYLTLLSG